MIAVAPLITIVFSYRIPAKKRRIFLEIMEEFTQNSGVLLGLGRGRNINNAENYFYSSKTSNQLNRLCLPVTIC
jgi:hypothetical protein